MKCQVHLPPRNNSNFCFNYHGNIASYKGIYTQKEKKIEEMLHIRYLRQLSDPTLKNLCAKHQVSRYLYYIYIVYIYFPHLKFLLFFSVLKQKNVHLKTTH